MKKILNIKKLYFFGFFLLCFCAIAYLGQNIVLQNVFADNNVVTNLSSVLYLQSVEAQKNGATYQAEFINTSTPYLKHTVITTITTSPVSFDDLSETEKQTIISNMQWSVNSLAISFTNSVYSCDDFDLVLQGQNLDITPKKSGPILIECNLNGFKTQINLMCNYAEPTQVNITTSDLLVQSYENYQPITLSAELNLQEYLNPNKTYTYNWYLNNQLLSEKTSILVLSKYMIKIGIMDISVEIDENKLLYDTEQIEITTDVDIPVSISHTGELEQTVGQNNTPITFVATIPVTDTYEVIWYLQSPSSDVFKKLNVQENSYTFNPLANTVGKYKIIAKIIYRNISQFSEIISFEIKPQEVSEEIQFTITATEYSNNSTNVSGFNCTIDTEEYYNDQDVIWYVGEKPFALGSDVDFSPIYAGEYVIEVRVREDNGAISKPICSYTLYAKTLQNVNIWVYISIALVVFVCFCVTSIIISNKVREKIW